MTGILGLIGCLAAAALGQPAGPRAIERDSDSLTEYRADLAADIERYVDRDAESLRRFYEHCHANPELSLQEKESAGRIAAVFKKAGYDTTLGVGGHGVVGVLKNGAGPTVLIRGDMDALPVAEETGLPYQSKVVAPGADGRPVGVMHACGHDVHQTCLIGAARALAELKDKWRGTLVLVAQPAEEIGKGALMMIQDGLFERFPKPDYCLALHVSGDHVAGDVAYTSGWALANVDSVDITIHGRGGHGSRPNQTIDPVVTAAHVIVALQTVVSRRNDPIDPAVITVGSVHSGSKHNIISSEARLQITVRSYTEETRKLLLDGIREVTVNVCRAMGCTREPDIVLRDEEFTPATFNDPGLTEAAVAVIERVVGAGHVAPVRARMGGEDFGRYAKHLDVPGFMFWLGCVQRDQYQASLKPGGPALPPAHSSKFAPDPDPTIRTGVRCLTSLALALFEAPDRPRRAIRR